MKRPLICDMHINNDNICAFNFGTLLFWKSKLLIIIFIIMGPKKAAGKKAPPGGENGGELDPEQKIAFLMHTCQSLQVQLGQFY